MDVSLIECISNEDDFNLELIKDIKYVFEENRRLTFTNWPFDPRPGTESDQKTKCTSDALAEAGFIYTPTTESPDATRCFFCCKELDGWEREDDPWEEHVSHTRGKCAFLKKAKIYETDITRKAFLQLEIQRQKNNIKAKYELLAQRLKDQAQQVRQQMYELVDRET